VLGPTEGTLGVDDPVLAIERVEQAVEALGIHGLVVTLGQAQQVALVGSAQGREHLATNERAEDADRKQVLGTAMAPALCVGRQAACGHDAVHVRVKAQLARPGVQHGGDAELGAEAFRIAAEVEQAVGGGVKEQVEEDGGMALREGA
jgi:hypothetical protein